MLNLQFYYGTTSYDFYILFTWLDNKQGGMGRRDGIELRRIINKVIGLWGQFVMYGFVGVR